MNNKLSIETAAYHNFLNMWDNNEFKFLRFGQAFYNHFKLNRLSNQDQLLNLYELDGDAAQRIINIVFSFN
jgi:hypothetical protein